MDGDGAQQFVSSSVLGAPATIEGDLGLITGHAITFQVLTC